MSFGFGAMTTRFFLPTNRKLILELPSYIDFLQETSCSQLHENISLKYNQQDATISRSIYFYKLFYMFQAVDEMELRCISSTVAASSSIGLKIPDAVCTILCF
jgi:hypothetical protein